MYIPHKNAVRNPNFFYFFQYKPLIMSVSGILSTGKAIQYALENIFTTEAGMRDSRVPKSLGIITNTNPSADGIGPAEEARRRGIKVRFIPFVCL